MRPLQFPIVYLLVRLGAAVLLSASECHGGSIAHAKITEVVNDVAVINPLDRRLAKAKPDDLFQAPEIMKTGSESRSEMVAEDQTVTRVGANTLFSFDARERTINLHEGSILFQSPSGRGGGNIRTAAATASVLGTTIIVAATREGGFKLLVIEGTGQLRMPNGITRIVHAGQVSVLLPGAREPGPALDFLLSEEVNSSRLIDGFKRPLPSWKKIRNAILAQNAEIARGYFRTSTAVIGTIVDPNTRINQAQALHLTGVPAPTPPPAPKSTPPPPPPTHRSPQ